MKIINAKVEEVIQKPGYEGMLEQIERGGRVCYKSEDKITPGSAEKFVNALIKRKHFAPLEHGTVYLKIPEYSTDDLRAFFEGNKYSYVVHVYDDSNSSFTDYVTTNYRVIIENDLTDLIAPFICDEPDPECHRKRRSFMITCDRGVSHEIVRHRVMSFNQESTRYVNYSNDKYGNELTFIKPCFWEESDPCFCTWKNACLDAEENYMMLLRQGAIPQEARSVLPNSVKTEILVTGFDKGLDPNEEDGWDHFLKLRCDAAAHPQIREIANMIKNILECEDNN